MGYNLRSNGESSLEGPKAEYLDVASDNQAHNSVRPRSASAASARSTITIVDDHSTIPILNKSKMQRRRTQVVTVRLTWWQCLKGVFLGPRVTERAASTSVDTPDIEEDDEVFEKTPCPYILNVQAVPSSKADTSKHEMARCMLDTGCIQGNIVSRAFASKLGFSDEDLKPLRQQEKHGGTSMTGHSHIPEGAIHITCVSNAHYDLVIGARSILKHKLLSVPNFGTTAYTKGTDKELDKIRQEIAKLRNDLQSFKHKRRTIDASKKDELESEIKEKEKVLKNRELHEELYRAKKELQLDPQNESWKAEVTRIENELAAIKGGGEPAPQSPALNVSGPDGTIRSATGFSSLRSGGKTSARR